MGNHIHELMHMSAMSLFVVAGAIALWDNRDLREVAVWRYAIMCFASAGFAGHVVVSHNLPKQGAFWVPWTAFGVTLVFTASWFYLLAMRDFLGLKTRLFRLPLALLGIITSVTALDVPYYALTRHSFLFTPQPRTGLSSNQIAVGEGAFSLQTLAEVLPVLFILSVVFGIGMLLKHQLQNRSRDVLVYVGLCTTLAIIINESLLALSVYSGVYLMAFSKTFETIRIHRDIRVRSRERYEAIVRRAEKMDAIGRLAGGVAHDFNNVLLSIGASIDLAERELPEGHAAREDLALATTGVNAGASLARQLLNLADNKEVKSHTVDINEFLSDSAGLLRTMARPAQLRFQPGRNVGKVLIARSQLSQVLMNLIVNARDAMPDGGTIEIRTRLQARSGPATSSESRWAIISVIDHGKGIPRHMLERVFEPFFTTKPEGTGMGLATLYGIVSRAGGHVEVDSDAERGTSFHVALPLRANDNPTAKSATPRSRSAGGSFKKSRRDVVGVGRQPEKPSRGHRDSRRSSRMHLRTTATGLRLGSSPKSAIW